MKTKTSLLLAVSFAAIVMTNCGGEPDDDDTDAGSDTDVDTDTDADADTDTDTGTDSDTDSDDDSPIDDLSVLEGRAFVLEIEESDWVEPNPTVGQEIGAYVPKFAVQIDAVDGTAIDATAGTVSEGAQDMCNEAVPSEGAVEPNPEFQLGPTELKAIIANGDIKALATIYDLTIEGAFKTQGASFEGTFFAVMDAREVYPLFTELGTDEPTAELVCDAILTFTGKPCEACESDGEEYCIGLKALSIEGVETPGLTLQELEMDDIDPSCLEDVFVAE